MRQVAVISGKGGTGKTTVCASIADMASAEMNLVLVDADVDAANLELITQPTKKSTSIFEAGKTAEINQEGCIRCGRCFEVCRFDAVTSNHHLFKINPKMCEGCLTCFYICPSSAIFINTRISGEWYSSETPYGTLFHAYLVPGEENSGKLVTEIKNAAKNYSKKNNAELILIDGPPGIGCPVIAALQGADLVLIVSEPTVSGLHDMERVQELCEHFGIPSSLILNKADLNRQMRNKILLYSKHHDIKILGELPYDEKILTAQLEGKPITSTFSGFWFNQFHLIWKNLKSLINL